MVKREGQLMHRWEPWKYKEKSGEEREKGRHVMWCSWWVNDARDRERKREEEWIIKEGRLENKQAGRVRKRERERELYNVCRQKKITFFNIGKNRR